ncbi:hypothetical protein AAG570_012761 [Ranatra chinensis]|uniref:Uncharacterized protein n=1 Tax=Ranatra chinensis TaxID=642074 RepID=A0ABD0YTG8_9HEMI
MASKRRYMFHKNKKQETTEIGARTSYFGPKNTDCIDEDEDVTRKKDENGDNLLDSASVDHLVKREGSIDSMCSELSFDLSGMVENDSSTVARMEQLQHEIDLLKNNCLLMDEEFETIKTNRNLPGLSSLLESSHQVTDNQLKESAKACFKGLYSLTTINRSLSSDFSAGTSTDDDDSPVHAGVRTVLTYGEESSFSSLEWDSQDAGTFIQSPTDMYEY